VTAITDTLKQITAQINELQKEYAEVISKIEEAWKTVYPQLKESYNKIANVFINLIDSVANVTITYLKTLLAIINEHQKDLKDLAILAAEIAQDVAKIVFKAVIQIRKDVEEFVVLLKNQIKALPIFDIAKEQFQDIVNLKIPETVLASIHELSEVIKAMLPTEELRQLFSATYEYIIKHVKHEKVSFSTLSYILPFQTVPFKRPEITNVAKFFEIIKYYRFTQVDDSNEIKKIYNYAVDAVASVIKLVESSGALDRVIDELFKLNLPVEFEALSKLPTITSLKVSLVNLIRNNELPSPADLYYTYRSLFFSTLSNFRFIRLYIIFLQIAILYLSKLRTNVCCKNL